MKHLKVYLVVSLILTLFSFFSIIKWSDIIFWILFYMIFTVFIMLLIKQLEILNYIKKYPFRNYDESDPYFSDDGIFKFENNGFYVKNLKKKDFIGWNDINFIIAYNVLLFDTSTMFLEIHTNGGVFKFNEEILGWYQLCNNINLKLSNINNRWRMILLNTPHMEDRVIVYNRNDITNSIFINT
ncbi:hypothetical protein AB670_03918 [Chryseobacterium sp. MOF25P]|nr:hypothetical protein AB670_03918 [Chryseobacterium sp. MOF25P]OBW43937.1 hypothetical protein AB671_03977 [Chryseobacterium sp. BGARF1]